MYIHTFYVIKICKAKFNGFVISITMKERYSRISQKRSGTEQKYRPCSVTSVWLCMMLIKHQAGMLALVDSTHVDCNHLRNSSGAALVPVVPFYVCDYS